ncbi:MAG TPA: hypothetical protein VFL31_03220, partial [Nitrospiraceae bacterium]|nr:hypothetical protein [Nitrospiraceae bacterium]
MTPARLSVSTWLVWTTLLAVTGCVEESRYQAVTAEVEQLKADGERMQDEVKGLEQQLASLRALNRQDEGTLTELEDEVRKKQDAYTLMQQRYEDRLTSLQAKVSTLLSQNRTLMREMKEAKRQESSLQALVTQYEKELKSPEPAVKNVTAPPVPKPDLSTSPGAAPQSRPATQPP